MNKNLSLPSLPEGFVAEFADRETYYLEIEKIFSKVFPGAGRAPAGDISEEAKAKRRELVRDFSINPWIVRILVFQKESKSVVGWISGEQHDWETFYFRNSGFLPEVRRKGIYSVLHDSIIASLRERGFERVISDHAPNNRAMLLLKIKFGYFIQSVTVDERFGPLVRLVYYLNPDRRLRFESRYELIHYDEEQKVGMP